MAGRFSIRSVSGVAREIWLGACEPWRLDVADLDSWGQKWLEAKKPRTWDDAMR